MQVRIRGRSRASAPSLRAALLSGVTSFPPALFFALLERQEQLPSPGRGCLVVGDGRDADARATQPEMRKDALATLPTFGDAFHDLAPCRGAGHVARAEQGAAHAVKVGVWRVKPAHTEKWARRTLTACATIEGAE
jgi:hypothetical protein